MACAFVQFSFNTLFLRTYKECCGEYKVGGNLQRIP